MSQRSPHRDGHVARRAPRNGFGVRTVFVVTEDRFAERTTEALFHPLLTARLYCDLIARTPFIDFEEMGTLQGSASGNKIPPRDSRALTSWVLAEVHGGLPQN
jgi:hypothetical protein